MHEPEGIRSFLLAEFGWTVADIAEVGKGAWSTAYGFVAEGRDLVIRIGRHVDDFDADRAASTHRSRLLPIPEVLHIGPFAHEHCCISTFAPGTPLELCSVPEWNAVVPSLADAIEAMRRCEPHAPVRAWRDTLLAVDSDHAGTRLSGWRERIERSPAASGALTESMLQLRAIDLDGVRPTLTHGDLINRNVHVVDGAVSGIFDWGCMRWGDHLYDLAWFDFWSPWFPDIDVGLLRAQLDRRWSDEGFEIVNRAERERACLLHIGADHLVYNSFTESRSGLDDLVERMRDLDLI